MFTSRHCFDPASHTSPFSTAVTHIIIHPVLNVLFYRLAHRVHGCRNPLLLGFTSHGSRGGASAPGSAPRLRGRMLLFRRRRDHWINYRAKCRGSRVLEHSCFARRRGTRLCLVCGQPGLVCMLRKHLYRRLSGPGTLLCMWWGPRHPI